MIDYQNNSNISTPCLNARPRALKDGGIIAVETGEVGLSLALLCPKAGRQMFIYYAQSSKAIYFVISLTYR